MAPNGPRVVSVVVGTALKAGKQVGIWACEWGQGGPGTQLPAYEGEPTLTLALSDEDAGQIANGHLAASVAFMQGRLKTTGDNSLLLEVLAWTASAGFGEVARSWTAPSAT